MTNSEYEIELQRLKIAEHGALGALKGTVAGLLIRQDVGLEMEPKDWSRLRAALDNAEAAHRAIVDHLCEPVS